MPQSDEVALDGASFLGRRLLGFVATHPTSSLIVAVGLASKRTRGIVWELLWKSARISGRALLAELRMIGGVLSRRLVVPAYTGIARELTKIGVTRGAASPVAAKVGVGGAALTLAAIGVVLATATPEEYQGYEAAGRGHGVTYEEDSLTANEAFSGVTLGTGGRMIV